MNEIEKLKISVVIPLLNEEESLNELSNLLEENLNKLAGKEWEVIYVDDGSTDKSFDIIKKICEKNNNFKVIRFRRNYGKSAALSVGFKRAEGEIIITMDADLQDDPNELQNLIAKINDGYDLVSGWKKKRYDPISKTLPSKFFNWVTSKASGIKLHDFNCGLKAYRKETAKSLNVYGEMHRFLPALAFRDGFKVTEIPVLHHARKHGYSKFGASRFIKGFLDLITVVFLTRFLKRPLHFFGTLGFLCSFLGLGIDIYLTIEWLLDKTYLSQRPLVFLGVGLIIVGVQFISMGLLGEMLVRNAAKEQNYSIKEII
jgi:glycosyltransferase involved in cell wall biosynthesis